MNDDPGNQPYNIFYSSFFFPNPMIPASKTEKAINSAAMTVLFCFMTCPTGTDGIVAVGEGVDV